MIDMNIHGLDRYIPEDVRRQVRKECGFGCVICGLALVEYHHIVPFTEIKVHDPKNIVLLCGSCHGHVTSGVWSNERVIAARKAPMTFQRGFAKDAFDFKPPFDLFVGDSCIRDVNCIVRKRTGEEWFTINPPEMLTAPPRISAKFFGPTGSADLEIDQNEWRCSTVVWDLKVSGPVIEVRNGIHKTMLRLRARPPHGLEIQRLRMIFNDTGIVIDHNGTIHLRDKGTEIQMNASDITRADAIFDLP